MELKESINVGNQFFPKINLYYWFTVLRQLRIQQEPDPDGVDGDAGYLAAVVTLEDLLEELLQREGDPFNVLARTTDLLLAIERNDVMSVERVLQEYPNETDLLPYMMMIPGTLFPSDSGFHQFLCVSPIGKHLTLEYN